MGSEVYQAQVLRAFFDTITGTDRNLTRIYMCVISLAKLRNESPEKLTFLSQQMKLSKEKKTLSIDILDYMTEAANSLESWQSQTAFGVTSPVKADDFAGISLDSL
ncbi:MAG: hypothetical protein Q4Q53_04615 [Methanocorpusculum sp.]|nr:hypothetical protein [Methanocorpusculum sp.]